MPLIGNVYYLPVLGEEALGCWPLSFGEWHSGQRLLPGWGRAGPGGSNTWGPRALRWTNGTGNKLGSRGEGVPILAALEVPNLDLLTQEGRDNLSRFLTKVGFLPSNTLPPQTKNDKTEWPFRAENEICSWTASFFFRAIISNTFAQAASLPVSHCFHLQLFPCRRGAKSNKSSRNCCTAHSVPSFVLVTLLSPYF